MATRPICPVCNSPAYETQTRFGVRHDCCFLWSWGGAPLADKATHDARLAAHEAFDALWRTGRMTRSAAYRALARELGVTMRDCHIKFMDAATAGRVRDAVGRILESAP